MISTAVCIVRPSKLDLNVLSQGIEVLARATRMVFAQGVPAGARCCADQTRGVRKDAACWPVTTPGAGPVRLPPSRAGERGSRTNVHESSGTDLFALEASREKDYEEPTKRRRNAIATRKAETRLARVETELKGKPRHCFGGRKLLRQGQARLSGVVGVQGMRCSPARPAGHTETK